jgi:hypothetical protein
LHPKDLLLHRRSRLKGRPRHNERGKHGDQLDREAAILLPDRAEELVDSRGASLQITDSTAPLLVAVTERAPRIRARASFASSALEIVVWIAALTPLVNPVAAPFAHSRSVLPTTARLAAPAVGLTSFLRMPSRSSAAAISRAAISSSN